MTVEGGARLGAGASANKNQRGKQPTSDCVFNYHVPVPLLF